MSDLQALWAECAACSRCEGARFQSMPILYVGATQPKILVLAQNPGMINPKTSQVQIAQAKYFELETSQYRQAEKAYDWAHADFKASRMYQKIAAVLGYEWLQWAGFTNAVKCRTPENAQPSREMEFKCTVWTSLLLDEVGAKKVIVLGRFAWRMAIGLYYVGAMANSYVGNPRAAYIDGITFFPLPHPAAIEWERTTPDWKRSRLKAAGFSIPQEAK